MLKRKYDEKYATMFAYLTDEELVHKAFRLGNEVNETRYLLPRQREELRGIKAQIEFRLRRESKPR
jgi:hypothetical protein